MSFHTRVCTKEEQHVADRGTADLPHKQHFGDGSAERKHGSNINVAHGLNRTATQGQGQARSQLVLALRAHAGSSRKVSMCTS
jgi:hypothetical protein